MESLADVLARSARIFQDKPFVIAKDRTISYAQFHQECGQFANVLRQLEVKPGQPVGLYLPSTIDFAVAFWGCQLLGAIPTPLNPMYRTGEVSTIVKLSGIRVVVTDRSTSAHAVRVQDGFGGLEVILESGSGAQPSSERIRALAPLMAAAPDAIDTPVPAIDDVAALFFTSGTTGVPKGVMQTQIGIYSSIRDTVANLGLAFGKEVILIVVPIFHNYGSILMEMALFSGATVILHERWNTRDVLDAVKTHRITFFAGTPTMFVYLSNDFDAARDDLSSLRVNVAAGAPLSTEIIARFEKLTGARLLQGYGATESVSFACLEPVRGIRKIGTAGCPVGTCSVEIVGTDGEILPTGEVGEIRIKGDWLARGYWGASAETNNVWKGGWLTGDLGKLDEDGYLSLVDRRKDLIITGGFNIAPLEVENFLYTHPGVKVCAVLGLPHDSKGEVPVAVIVPHETQPPTSAALEKFCRDGIAAYKIPRDFYLIDEMPLGPIGKVLKRELRDRIDQGRLQKA